MEICKFFLRKLYKIYIYIFFSIFLQDKEKLKNINFLKIRSFICYLKKFKENLLLKNSFLSLFSILLINIAKF